jgi:hypothetical protein
MTLTPEQKQTVSAWVAAGDNLSAIQKKLADQLKISLTYMDVRFLVDDLGLELKNAAPKADATDVTKGAAKPAAAPEKKGFLDKLKEKVGVGANDDEDEAPADDFAGEDDAAITAAPPPGASTLKIEVDRLIRPGAVVSGTVTFSDGISGKWALDQAGRLMLETGRKDYRPSPADVQAFQRELSAQLQRHGF